MWPHMKRAAPASAGDGPRIDLLPGAIDPHNTDVPDVPQYVRKFDFREAAS